MEDAIVLAEVLETSGSVKSGLESYDKRRKPHVKWVQQQSLELFAQMRQPPARRSAFLREKGETILRDSFIPLTAAP